MVAELRPADESWRRPGCGANCALRDAFLPGLRGRITLEDHDPDDHEQYGRSGVSDPERRYVLESGPLVMDRRSLWATVDGVEVRLTPIEWRVFLAIVDGAGAFVSQRRILTAGWSSEYADETHLLRVNVSRLRVKLGRAGGLIETIVGMGYRFLLLPPGQYPHPATPARNNLRTVGRWARDHERCRECGTTERPHDGHGYCGPCKWRVSREPMQEGRRGR